MLGLQRERPYLDTRLRTPKGTTQYRRKAAANLSPGAAADPSNKRENGDGKGEEEENIDEPVGSFLTASSGSRAGCFWCHLCSLGV